MLGAVITGALFTAVILIVEATPVLDEPVSASTVVHVMVRLDADAFTVGSVDVDL